MKGVIAFTTLCLVFPQLISARARNTAFTSGLHFVFHALGRPFTFDGEEKQPGHARILANTTACVSIVLIFYTFALLMLVIWIRECRSVRKSRNWEEWTIVVC